MLKWESFGKRETPVKNGDDVDAFDAREYYYWRKGAVRRIKQRFNRRARHRVAQELRMWYS